jgi:hemerythrin-like domain-containing protein
MKALDQLRQEHQTLRTALAVLAAMCDRDARGQEVPLEHFEQALDLLADYVDVGHHGREEELLFPALAQTDAARPGGPVGPLTAEHKLARQYIKTMRKLLRRVARRQRGARKQFAEHVTLYSNLMEKHIRTEEEVLFPMIERLLSEGRKQDISAGFEAAAMDERDRQRFGEMLESLRRTYGEVSAALPPAPL